MGLLDGMGDQIAKHKDKIDGAVEKGGDYVDSKTDNKYAEHVDKGQDFLSDKASEYGDGHDGPTEAREA